MSDSTAVNIVEPHSARGRARLAKMLEAATELFLKEGYEQTSIDAILVRSGGSKATLYAYFPTKEDLFRAVIDSVVEDHERPLLDEARDPKAVLEDFSTTRLRVIMSARHGAILRLIVAERERFPDLARIYYERGPQRSHQLLVTYFEALHRRGLIDLADADEAAELFVSMLLQRWYKELLFFAAPAPTEAMIQERAQRAVRWFLDAFRRRTH